MQRSAMDCNYVQRSTVASSNPTQGREYFDFNMSARVGQRVDYTGSMLCLLSSYFHINLGYCCIGIDDSLLMKKKTVFNIFFFTFK